MHEQIPQQPGECVECLVAFLVTVSFAQAQCWSVTPPQDDVMVSELRNDIIGLTQEL